MNFVNSLFLFTTTILINNFSVAFENTVDSIENIYINVLIQRYMVMESSLWNEINTSATKTNELILKIRNEHNEFFSSEALDSVISNEQKSKFKKYLNLSVFESYVRDDQNSRSISNVILSDYNSTLTNDLFDEIRKVFEIDPIRNMVCVTQLTVYIPYIYKRPCRTQNHKVVITEPQH